MMRMITPVLLAILAGALAGCAAAPPPLVQTRIVVQRLSLPAALLVCAPEPPVGDWRGPHGGSAAATYIVRLRAAHADCYDDVLTIAGMQNAAGK